MLTLTQQDFLRLVKFVQKNYGIDLSKKQQLIVSRLSNTITGLGFTDFTAYVDYIINTKNAVDIDLMLNKLTTNYTYFLREESHFDYFKNTILPYLESKKTDRHMNIWSAGCSSGEEPYTISMMIKEYLGGKASMWDTRVLATDISQNVLTTAQNAQYNAESLSKIPPSWKTKYFTPVAGTDMFTVAPLIKSNVIFQTFNLMDPIRFKVKFDVIFCRNVMIYFDQDTKEALVGRFYQATNPGGFLLIGHSEGINKEATSYRYIMPATYRKE